MSNNNNFLSHFNKPEETSTDVNQTGDENYSNPNQNNNLMSYFNQPENDNFNQTEEVKREERVSPPQNKAVPPPRKPVKKVEPEPEYNEPNNANDFFTKLSNQA